MRLDYSFLLFIVIFSICLNPILAQIDFKKHTIIDNYNVTEGAAAVFTADIDGDGDMDILSASLENDLLGWFENQDGKGMYSDQHIIADDLIDVRVVHAADMDGDGDLDVISSSFTNQVKLVWYENLDGLGNFGQEKIISDSPHGVQEVIAADLDNDGDNDVVVGTFFDNTVSWFENLNGAGNFGNERVINSSATFLKDIHASDADGDGDIDIFSTYGVNTSRINWYRNNGFGNFTSGGTVTSEVTTPEEVFTADVDGDGDQDVVATHSSNSVNDRLAWYENLDGLGDWSQEKVITASPDNVVSVSAADMDGDGDIDLVAASVFDYKITWYENINGNFGGENLITTEIFGTPNIKIADLDNDGDMDVCSATTTDSKIAWYENIDGKGNFGEQILLSVNAMNPVFAIAADLDDDGDLDVISASEADNEVAWYENINGQIAWGRQQIISTAAASASSVYAGDINGDGAIDIISSSRDDGKIAWYENSDGKGNFSSEKVAAIDELNAYFVEAHDLDGDGDMDLIYTTRSKKEIVSLDNDGAGNFSNRRVIVSEVNWANHFTVADFDNDGDPDIAFPSQVDHFIAWHKNVDGLGNFGPQIMIDPVVNSANALSSADIDDDGDLDLVGSSYEDVQAFWYENMDGEGTFGEQRTVFELEGSYASDATTADMDGDLDIDVLCFSGEYGQVMWFENLDGLGTFGVPQQVSNSVRSASMITTADLDGDGNMDVLTPVKLDSKILWYENGSANGNDLNGVIRLDNEADGCNEMDEVFANVKVTTIQNGEEMSTYSLQNGIYQLFPKAGDYSTMIDLPDYFNINPPVYNATFSSLGNASSVDFCVSKDEEYVDLGIDVFPITEARPGFMASYILAFQNLSTSKMDGTIELKYNPDKLALLSASIPVADQTSNSLIFNYSDLGILDYDEIQLDFQVFAPPTVNIDEKLIFNATIYPITDDDNPTDNVFHLEQTVIGSYDPNDISVLEGESILLEEAGNALHYIIRFQNTGTAEAINVKVTNRLDSKLDGTSFELEAMSHEGQTMILNNRDLSFTFDNIYLPDSTADEAASHGYIAYSIKPKPNVKIGDVISNQADIFFDFNPAIITNTVKTEIVEIDNLAPTMICQNIVVELGTEGSVIVAPLDIDNGSIDNVAITAYSLSPNFFDCTNIGDNSVALIGTDEQGNVDSCAAIINVIDALPPLADLPELPELSAECELVNISPPSATDNCGGLVTVTSNVDLPITEQGTTTITWTYIDEFDNSSTQTQQVVIKDDSSPTAITQDIIVDLNDQPSVTINPEQVDNGSFDNCGIGFMELQPNTFTETGEYDVLFRVVDINNLDATESVTITISDSTVNVIDPGLSQLVQIIPNPAKDLIRLKLGTERLEEVFVYTAVGELVGAYKESSIDISTWPAGIYGLWIVTKENRVGFKRLVKF